MCTQSSAHRESNTPKIPTQKESTFRLSDLKNGHNVSDATAHAAPGPSDRQGPRLPDRNTAAITCGRPRPGEGRKALSAAPPSLWNKIHSSSAHSARESHRKLSLLRRRRERGRYSRTAAAIRPLNCRARWRAGHQERKRLPRLHAVRPLNQTTRGVQSTTKATRPTSSRELHLRRDPTARAQSRRKPFSWGQTVVPRQNAVGRCVVNFLLKSGVENRGKSYDGGDGGGR